MSIALRKNPGYPHDGREVSLMLSGRKKLAVFSYNSPSEDKLIGKNVPEESFAPYVMRGRIIRIEASIWHAKEKTPIRLVCFTLPGSEWRAQTLFWIKREIYGGNRIQDEADDIMIARLLGYTPLEIAAFRQAFSGAAFAC